MAGANGDGSFAVQHAQSRDHTPLNLSPLKTPGDRAGSAGNGAAPPPGPPSPAIPVLRRWLAWTSNTHRTWDPQPLDDHTLSDIGLTRIDILYRD